MSCPGFSGVAVHDAWAPYDTYTAATHGLCNAHLLREFQAVIDTTTHTQGPGAGPSAGPGALVEAGWCWAEQAAGALVAVKNLVDTAIKTDGTLEHLDPEAVKEQTTLLRSALVTGKTLNAHRSTPIAKKHHALANRVLTRWDDYLRFTTDPAVPFDNNPAEREIPMIKLRQKISGTMRTTTGAETFCTIRSYLATTTKHGLTHLQALTQLAAGNPWLPQHATVPY